MSTNSLHAGLQEISVLVLPQMNPGIPKANPGKHAGQVHAGTSLQVLRVSHSSVINQSRLTSITNEFS